MILKENQNAVTVRLVGGPLDGRKTTFAVPDDCRYPSDVQSHLPGLLGVELKIDLSHGEGDTFTAKYYRAQLTDGCGAELCYVYNK